MIDQGLPGSAKTIQDHEDVKNQRLQGILRYWNEMRGGGTMPSFRQIDPIDIPKLLPIVLIADVAPTATTMRLLGTDATNAYGRETRGMDIRNLVLGEFSPLWLKVFALVRETGSPASASGSFRNRSELLDVDMLLTPLSDDGEMITHIFGGLLIRPAPCVAVAEPHSILGGFSSVMDSGARQAT
jgi:hypothetical protein